MRCPAMNEALPSRSLGNEAPAWQTSMHQHDHTGHLHQSATPARPAATKRCENGRDTAQPRDARDACGLGAETRTTHHATRLEDSMIIL